MKEKRRRCAVLLAIFAMAATSSGCTSSADSRDAEIRDSVAPAPTETLATDAASQPAEPAATPPSEIPSGETYAFALTLKPDDVTYLVVENEFHDICGFPPLLTVTTSIKEKRSIIQRILLPTARDGTSPAASHLPHVSWECDRLELHERGLKDDTSFDSLRDLYPPPTLWQLGGIPGSVATFVLDPRTGKASQFNLRPAQIAGGNGSAKLSRTAEKCALTTDNLAKLLDDLGPLYLPDGPKRVGERWGRTYFDDQKTLGLVVTKLTCTLRSVRENSGHKIATIDVTSEITLQDRSGGSSDGSPSRSERPAQASQPNQQHYSLDKANCSGAVEFDLTTGEPLQVKMHRELEFFAPLESTQQTAMVKEIRTGWGQDLRVTVSHTPPPKPVIVGGPKPPVVPMDNKSSPTTQPATAPVRDGPPERQPPAAAPAATVPPRATTSPPGQPTGQPSAKPSPSRRPPAPATSRPAGPAKHKPAVQL